MAWYDVVSKYRRTRLGPFWSILLTAISVACMAALGAKLFKQPLKSFLPYVACGMVVWAYISSLIMESCNVFLISANSIQNVKLPLFSFILEVYECSLGILFYLLIA